MQTRTTCVHILLGFTTFFLFDTLSHRACNYPLLNAILRWWSYIKKKRKRERKTDASCTFYCSIYTLREKYHFFEQQAHQIHEDKSEIVEKTGKRWKIKRKCRVKLQGKLVSVWSFMCEWETVETQEERIFSDFVIFLISCSCHIQ